MNSVLFEAFKNAVLPWYQSYQRDLPWRNTKDPYAIWLSEIILQQTRVQQGLSYYHQFLTTFPTVKDLADAPEDQVLRLWQGLGYYSRARNLHRTAQLIVSQFDGKFPNTWEGLLQLPGVGPYTAAAIGSFAFNVPKAAIDGNVLRWTSRLFGSHAPIDLPATRSWLQAELDGWIAQVPPAHFNQAAMEFGAILCTPVPKCMDCPIQEYCDAFRQDKVNEIPVKSKKVKVEERYVYAFLFQDPQKKFPVQRRASEGIWGNLYTLPMWISEHPMEAEDVLKNAQNNYWLSDSCKTLPTPFLTTHLLTHRKLKVHIFSILLQDMPKNASIFERWISVKEAGNLGFPKVFENYLKEQFPEYAGLI